MLRLIQAHKRRPKRKDQISHQKIRGVTDKAFYPIRRRERLRRIKKQACVLVIGTRLGCSRLLLLLVAFVPKESDGSHQ
jgi:hypothetical protein